MKPVVKILQVMLGVFLSLALTSGIWVAYSARNACATRTGAVGPTWQKRDLARSLVDDVVPEYQIGERHRIFVRAAAPRTLAAAAHLTEAEQPLTRFLGLLRRSPAPPETLFEGLRRTSSLVLRRPGREWVFATIAESRVRRRFDSVRAFRAYTLAPGESKVAVSLRAVPRPNGAWLSTETRLYFASPESCLDFAHYWSVIYPGSALTRLELLRAIKLRAETGEADDTSQSLQLLARAAFTLANRQPDWGPL